MCSGFAGRCCPTQHRHVYGTAISACGANAAWPLAVALLDDLRGKQLQSNAVVPLAFPVVVRTVHAEDWGPDCSPGASEDWNMFVHIDSKLLYDIDSTRTQRYSLRMFEEGSSTIDVSCWGTQQQHLLVTLVPWWDFRVGYAGARLETLCHFVLKHCGSELRHSYGNLSKSISLAE